MIDAAKIANMYGHIGDVPVPPRKPKPKGRFAKRFAKLPQEERTTALLLLEGKAVLIRIGGKPYAVSKAPYGWRVHCVESGSQVHEVNLSKTECSCPRSRFGSGCKHLEALKCL